MLEQGLERDCLLALQRLRVGERDLGHPDAVDDDEMGLGPGVGRDRLQLVRVDDADAAALHLLEEHATLDGPHEHDDLDRLDVGAGADHVHGHGDARLEAVAERLDEVARLAAVTL